MSPSLAALRRSLRSWRRSFRSWRRSRPFWGGLIAILAGAEMYAITALTAMTNVKLQLMIAATPAGMSAILIFIIFTLLAVLTWFQPHLRLATGLIIVVFSLAAIMLTNLGGFVIGTLMGVHGGALMAAWRPRSASETPLEQKQPWKKLTLRTLSTIVPAKTVESPSAQDESASPKEKSPATKDEPPTKEGDQTGSEPLTRRARRNSSSRTLGLAVALLALTLGMLTVGSTPASAASRQATGDDDLIDYDLLCEWFPWMCETSTDTGTDTDTDTGTNTDIDTGIDTSTDTDSDISTDTDGTASDVKCNPQDLPQGYIGTGSDKAATAAEILEACLAEQEEAESDSEGVETGLPPLGAPITHLNAARQDLSGLAYDGVVTLKTAGGSVDVLKFRADSVKLTGMDQSVSQPGNANFTLKAGRQATLTGNVVMYVLSQRGMAFGLLPLELSAESPPPLVTESMIFTDVESEIVYIRADSLVIPRAQIAVA